MLRVKAAFHQLKTVQKKKVALLAAALIWAKCCPQFM